MVTKLLNLVLYIVTSLIQSGTNEIYIYIYSLLYICQLWLINWEVMH